MATDRGETGVGSRGTVRVTEHDDSPWTPRIGLESTLVRYGDGPDRRTIYPPGLSSVARMSTWLSADADVFRDLSEMR